MDINLPGRSGFEVLKEIRALGEDFSSIPVIALTANAMEDHVRKCYQAGMAGHVVKPFTSQELNQAIARRNQSSSVKGKAKAKQRRDEEFKRKPPALNKQLRDLKEEFGPEYTVYLVKSSVTEIERLLGEATVANDKQNYEVLQLRVHDLKSVSGSIGLKATQDLAESIEVSCVEQSFERVPDLFQRLVAENQNELSSLLKNELFR